MGGVLTKLIDANTTIPTKKSQIFLLPLITNHLLKFMYCKERSMAADNKTIGRFHLEVYLKHQEEHQIEVTLTLTPME